MRSSNLDALPNILAFVRGVGGLEAERRMAEAFGGLRITVPRSAKPNFVLTKVVGQEVAAALCSLCGGEAILVPLGKWGEAAARRRKVLELVAEGHSANQIAARLKICTRTVFRIKRRARLHGNEAAQRPAERGRGPGR